jgi:hypothetical protein
VQVLKTGLALPGALVLDATSVYWVNAGTNAKKYHDGSVMKMPLSGGEPTVLASQEDSPNGLILTKTHVYWTTADWENNQVGAIRSVPIGGGTVMTVVAGQPAPQGIVSNDQDIYWVNAGTPPNHTDGSLNRMPLGGGAATPLATGQVRPFALAVGDGRVFWTNLKGGTVRSMALDGSDFREHASGQSNPWGIVASEGDLFWSELSAGRLWKLSLGESQPPALVANTAAILFSVDSSFVYSGHYVAAATSGAVFRTTRDGLQKTAIQKQDYPFASAVNNKHVYWTLQGTDSLVLGSLCRAPKDFVAQ